MKLVWILHVCPFTVFFLVSGELLAIMPLVLAKVVAETESIALRETEQWVPTYCLVYRFAVHWFSMLPASELSYAIFQFSSLSRFCSEFRNLVLPTARPLSPLMVVHGALTVIFSNKASSHLKKKILYYSLCASKQCQSGV